MSALAHQNINPMEAGAKVEHLHQAPQLVGVVILQVFFLLCHSYSTSANTTLPTKLKLIECYYIMSVDLLEILYKLLQINHCFLLNMIYLFITGAYTTSIHNSYIWRKSTICTENRVPATKAIWKYKDGSSRFW